MCCAAKAWKVYSDGLTMYPVARTSELQWVQQLMLKIGLDPHIVFNLENSSTFSTCSVVQCSFSLKR